MNVKISDFEVDVVFQKPLMAHLATVDEDEPRDSPVWFLWEDSCIWLFGTEKDSFIKRLVKYPKCALGVVDFDAQRGILQHVGVRGAAELHSVDSQRLHRFVSKYLGEERDAWNRWFMDNIVDPLDVMVQVVPKSIVAQDASFFRTGPSLASHA